MRDYHHDSRRRFGRHLAYDTGVNIRYGLVGAEHFVKVSDFTHRVAIAGMVVANNIFPEKQYKPAQGAKDTSAFTVDDYEDIDWAPQPQYNSRPCQSGEGAIVWNNCCAPRSVGVTWFNSDADFWSYTATWNGNGVGSEDGTCPLPVDYAGFIRANYSVPTYITPATPGNPTVTPHGNFLYWGASIGSTERPGLNKRYMWTTGLPNLEDDQSEVTIYFPEVIDDTHETWRIRPWLYNNGMETQAPLVSPDAALFISCSPWIASGVASYTFPHVQQTDDMAWQFEKWIADDVSDDYVEQELNNQVSLVHSGTIGMAMTWRPMKELEYMPKEGTGLRELAFHMAFEYDGTLGSNNAPSGDLAWLRATTPNVWRNLIAQGIQDNSMIQYIKMYPIEPKLKDWWRNHYGYEGFIGYDLQEKGSLKMKDYWLQSNGFQVDIGFNLDWMEYYKVMAVRFPNNVSTSGQPTDSSQGTSGQYNAHWHKSAERPIDNRQTIPQGFPPELATDWIEVTSAVAAMREDYRFTDYGEDVFPPAFSVYHVFNDPLFSLQTAQKELVLAPLKQQLKG